MKKIILGFALIVFIGSCKKDNSAPNNNNTNNPPVNSVLLAKYVELDTTLSAPNDTLSICYFTYDNTNRLTSETQVYFGSAHDSVEVDQNQIFYQGTDTLMYKLYES